MYVCMYVCMCIYIYIYISISIYLSICLSLYLSLSLSLSLSLYIYIYIYIDIRNIFASSDVTCMAVTSSALAASVPKLLTSLVPVVRTSAEQWLFHPTKRWCETALKQRLSCTVARSTTKRTKSHSIQANLHACSSTCPIICQSMKQQQQQYRQKHITYKTAPTLRPAGEPHSYGSPAGFRSAVPAPRQIAECTPTNGRSSPEAPSCPK